MRRSNIDKNPIEWVDNELVHSYLVEHDHNLTATVVNSKDVDIEVIDDWRRYRYSYLVEPDHDLTATVVNSKDVDVEVIDDWRRYRYEILKDLFSCSLILTMTTTMLLIIEASF